MKGKKGMVSTVFFFLRNFIFKAFTKCKYNDDRIQRLGFTAGDPTGYSRLLLEVERNAIKNAAMLGTYSGTCRLKLWVFFYNFESLFQN